MADREPEWVVGCACGERFTNRIEYATHALNCSAQLANYALPRLRRLLEAGSVTEAEAETMLRAVGRWL